MRPLLLPTLILGNYLVPDTLGVVTPQNHQSLSNECIVSLQNKECLYSATDGLYEDPEVSPMKVDLTMQILQISEVNDDIGTVYFTAVFMFEWEETRITVKNASESSDYGFTWITLRNWQERVWYPIIYIKNLKDFEVYKIARQPSSSCFLGKRLKRLDNIVTN